MTKLVVFDVDGTLADTDLLLTITWLKLFDKYGYREVPTVRRIASYSGPPLRFSLKKEFPDIPLEESYKLFQEVSATLYDEYLVGYPGQEKLFKRLKEKGYLIAINTNKRRNVCLEVLEKLKLSQYVDEVVAGGDAKAKPDPEGLLLLLSKFDLKPEEALYVGDSEYDVLTARNAKVPCMIVNWGPRHLPKGLEADFYLDSYDDFLEVISNAKGN